jgi:hypothetical protein
VGGAPRDSVRSRRRTGRKARARGTAAATAGFRTAEDEEGYGRARANRIDRISHGACDPIFSGLCADPIHSKVICTRIDYGRALRAFPSAFRTRCTRFTWRASAEAIAGPLHRPPTRAGPSTPGATPGVVGQSRDSCSEPPTREWSRHSHHCSAAVLSATLGDHDSGLGGIRFASGNPRRRPSDGRR